MLPELLKIVLVENLENQNQAVIIFISILTIVINLISDSEKISKSVAADLDSKMRHQPDAINAIKYEYFLLEKHF